MIVIFYYYPLMRKRETRREDPEDRRTDDLRGTHGRWPGITKEEGGEREKRGLLTDDKERGRERKRKRRKKGKPEEEGQEAICEEIVAACQSSDCSRLMYGMLTNGFRYVITRVVARNEIYVVVSRNYVFRVVGPIFYFAGVIRALHRATAGQLRPTDCVVVI